MSREADMAQPEKMHDRTSVRRELAKTLRKFLPVNEQPPAPAAAPAQTPEPEKMHDATSVRRELVKSLKRVVEGHANEMAALRERELKKTVDVEGGFGLSKSIEVVDSNGKHKTIRATNKNPAPPTKDTNMTPGSGGVIVPGKKMAKAERTPGTFKCPKCGFETKEGNKRQCPKCDHNGDWIQPGETQTYADRKSGMTKKAEPPMAKPPSGSIPGKTVPQSQPAGAPAAGAPKSSAMPTAKGEMCEHGIKKGESCQKCMDSDGDYDGDDDKPKEMKKGDFGTSDSGRVATTPAQAASSSALAAAAVKPVLQSAAGVRGTPVSKIKVPGRDGTAGLVNPQSASAVRGTPEFHIKVPGRGPAGAPAPAAAPAAPVAPLGRVK